MSKNKFLPSCSKWNTDFTSFFTLFSLLFLGCYIPFGDHWEGAQAHPISLWGKAGYTWMHHQRQGHMSAFEEQLKVSWHLLLVTKHIPNFVPTGAWTENPLPCSRLSSSFVKCKNVNVNEYLMLINTLFTSIHLWVTAMFFIRRLHLLVCVVSHRFLLNQTFKPFQR